MNNPLKKILILLVLLATVLSCQQEARKTVDPPQGLITPDRAKLLQQTYTATRYDTLTKYLGKRDNRSIWFSIEEMEGYLKYAKQKAAKRNEVVSGIRIYMGAYPTGQAEGDRAGYSTVFLVPTGKTATAKAGLLYNAQEKDGDLDIPPLNEGHNGIPPDATYPQ